jgi:hypothetical protein
MSDEQLLGGKQGPHKPLGLCEHLVGQKPDLTRCSDRATQIIGSHHVCDFHFHEHTTKHSHTSWETYGCDDSYGDTDTTETVDRDVTGDDSL